MSELKPCPFCGNEAQLIAPNDGTFYGMCRKSDGGCGTRSSYAWQRSVAIEAWNRRAQPEATSQAVADAVVLNKIGKSIGYGHAIQILGQLWDDMLQAQYGIAARHQEGMFRRDDIERIEAGLPIGRKVVYFQKRGRKGQITAWIPFDAEIPNVAHIISDTPLYGWPQTVPTPDAPQAKGSEVGK